MLKQNVSALYDQLSNTEQNIKSANTYPIHKRLDFSPDSTQDIYDWIMKTGGLPPTGCIIDAGCGTGWGCQRLSQHTDANITGISLSPHEIKLATQSAKKLGKSIDFKVQSFDEIEAQSADLIIAVESVKHSPDIKKTITNLINALKPKGKLIIVDDFYESKTVCETTHTFMQDWHLFDLLTTEHIQKQAKSQDTAEVTIDITDHTNKMHIPLRLFSKVKQLASAIALVFRENDLAIRAFKGGFMLDQLYAEKKMRYLAVIIERR